MVDTLPCPGCHTPLPPEATGCQICMRARTKQEIVRGYAKLREEKDRRRKRPWKILAAVLVLGAAGKLATTHGERIKAAGAAAAASVARWVDDMRDPKNYSGVKAAPSAAADSAPVAPENALSKQLLDPAPAAPAAPAARAAQAPAAGANPVETPIPDAIRPLAKNERRVSGTVFDLATLRPVPDATVTFHRDGAERVSAQTDDEGAFRVVLTKDEGWMVAVKAPQHRAGQVLDLDPSYRVRDADERKAALEQLNDADLRPAPVEWKPRQNEVKVDLVVVPEHWTATPNP